jgi:hypothetical protein
MMIRSHHAPGLPTGAWCFTVQRTAALLIFLAITAAALPLNDSLVSLGRYGYLGVFLASLIGSATIILPMPAFAVTFAMGGTLPSPLLAGLGAGLGELNDAASLCRCGTAVSVCKPAGVTAVFSGLTPPDS